MTDAAMLVELRRLAGEVRALRADVAQLLRLHRRPREVWTDERLAALFRRVWTAHGTAAWSVRSLREAGLVDDGKPLGYALAALRDAGGQLDVWELRALGRKAEGQLWRLVALPEVGADRGRGDN